MNFMEKTHRLLENAERRSVSKMGVIGRNSLYNKYEDEGIDNTDPRGEDENETGYGDEYKSPEELMEEEENEENREENSDKKSKGKKNGKDYEKIKAEAQVGKRRNSKKPNTRAMVAKAKELKAMPCPYPRDCPTCKQKSIFYEPVGPMAFRLMISYILSAITFGATPIRKTRYVCLNPKCKSYYVTSGTRFIDNPIDFGGALLYSHLIQVDKNPFRLKDTYNP